ncbi:hypothetical protein L9G15_25040, partial [Shewanella sp. A3A]|nr:hypothetical protein [Shewanella ferrihydritica]
VRLPITFGTRNNYRTEIIDFAIAHIRLPYNAILGYPALAKFVAVTYHSYNVLKMPGSISGHGPGRAWARPKKAHGRKLRPMPSQA